MNRQARSTTRAADGHNAGIIGHGETDPQVPQVAELTNEHATLDRLPDFGGLTGLTVWSGVLEGGASLDGIADAFAASEQLRQLKRGETDADTSVRAVYRDATVREGDARASASGRRRSRRAASTGGISSWPSPAATRSAC